jgi:hypothetical protein
MFLFWCTVKLQNFLTRDPHLNTQAPYLRSVSNYCEFCQKRTRGHGWLLPWSRAASRINMHMQPTAAGHLNVHPRDLEGFQHQAITTVSEAVFGKDLRGWRLLKAGQAVYECHMFS